MIGTLATYTTLLCIITITHCCNIGLFVIKYINQEYQITHLIHE